MKKILQLVLKDFLLEFRNPYAVYAIGFYLITLVYISYTAFAGLLNASGWNAVFWMILLFTQLIAIGKSFLTEADRTLYYFFLDKPEIILAGKLIFNLLYSVTMGLLGMWSMLFFLPVGIENLGLFITNLVLGLIGVSAALTMVSSITSGSGNQHVVLAVLGFPVLIPIFLIGMTTSRKAMSGAVYADVTSSIIYLVCLDIIIIALVFILFPYSRKK